MQPKPRWILFWGMLCFSLVLKMIPYVFQAEIGNMNWPVYPWNFSPELAIALYCGVFLRDKPWFALVPLALRMVSDVMIATYEQHSGYLIYDGQLVIYCCLFLMSIGGLLLRENRHLVYVGLVSLCAAMGFFLASNTAVWWWGDTFTKDLNGLAQCYFVAIPFFRNALISTVAFSMLMISPLGVTVTATKPVEKLEEEGRLTTT